MKFGYWYNYLNFKEFFYRKRANLTPFNPIFAAHHDPLNRGYGNDVSRIMKKFFASAAFLFLSWGLHAQDVPVIKLDQLKKLLHDPQAGEVHVINFWATWCAPCIKELPLFQQYHDNHPAGRMTLVSMDFVDKLERVKAFVKKKNLTPSVLLLDEVDYNSWIDLVDKRWSGALPATIVINPKTGKRAFHEGELHEGELEKLVASVNE